jgi:hypothetical protein
MHKAEGTGAAVANGSLSAAFLTKVIAKRRNIESAPPSEAEQLPPRIYGIMAATTLATFATLTASYQLLFTNQPFA